MEIPDDMLLRGSAPVFPGQQQTIRNRFARFATHRQDALASITALLLSMIFFAQGYIFLRQVGPQEDEVEFAKTILPPKKGIAYVHIGEHELPVMMAAYAGALKAIAYDVILWVRPADTHALRVPVLVAGAATLLLFFFFFRMALGKAVAISATALLATDTMFVILTVIDFGIVVVQHLLLAAGLVLLLLFHRGGRKWMLAAASFAAGLALWDKATFLWVLAAWGISAWIFLRPAIQAHFTRANLAICVVGVLAGCSPLLFFNFVQRWAGTASGSGGLDPPGLQKAVILWRTLDGSSLWGFLTRSEVDLPETAGDTRVERAGIWLSEISGHQESHLLGFALLASVLVLPLLGKRPESRIIGFSAVAFVVGFMVMLPFRMGGNGSHHAVLLWPLPQMAVAAAIWGLARRVPRFGAILGAAATAVLALSGMAVTAECYAQIVQRGPADHFSDAIHPLRAALANASTKGVYSPDWGILGPLRFLGRGSLPLKVTDEMWDDEETPLRRMQIDRLFDAPYLAVYYSHRGGRDNRRFERMMKEAAARGRREEVVTRIPDRHGRTIYSVVRFVPR